MRRFFHALLLASLLIGGLMFGMTSARAAPPWRRPWGRYGAVGVYRPYWGYRVYGFGLGPGYLWRGYGWGYPVYGGVVGYPGYYWATYPYAGYGLGGFGWGYPGYSGVSVGMYPYAGGFYPW